MSSPSWHRVRSTLASACVVIGGAVASSYAQGYALWEHDGEAPDFLYGEAVAVVGDIDGDGFADVAVGLPNVVQGGRGRVQLLSGRDGTSICAWNGAQPFDAAILQPSVQGLGHALDARASSFGTRLIAGAPRSDLGALFQSVSDVGAAALLWIAAPHETHGAVSPSLGAEFGFAVASIGDINGDLISEYIVGAPLFPQNGTIIGRVAVCSGRDGTLLREHLGSLATSHRFGSAVCGLGDINGDSVPDYAIADPQDGANAAGRVRVFSGANGALLRELSGNANDFFGDSLCAAGRANGINANGDMLLAVGAPRADLSGGRQDAGYVKVFNARTGALLVTIEGQNASEICGFALSLGNSAQNSQAGAPDLLVGCPGANSGGSVRSGRVRRFSMPSGAELSAIENPQPSNFHSFGFSIASGRRHASTISGYDFVVGAPGNGRVPGNAYVFDTNGNLLHALTGVATNGRFGEAVAFVGDIDGDDSQEIAVGAPVANSSRGEVRFFSTTTGVSLNRNPLRGETSARLGASLASVGSPLDADTMPCGLIAGAPGGERVITTVSCVPQVVLHAAPNAIHSASTLAGKAVAFVGDLDLDHIEDFAVGVPNQSLAAGVEVGRVTLYSGRNGAVLTSRDGVAAGDHFGSAICGAGDLNRDGRADFAVGAPDTDIPLIGRNGIGTVYFLDGLTGNALHATAGVEPGEGLGSSLVAIGDVNGDGVIDVASGAPRFDGLLGNQRGRVRVISGSNASTLHTITGSADQDLFGTKLARGGDWNADGIPDLVVGVPLFDFSPSLQNVGRVQIHSGANGSLLESITSGSTIGQQSGFAIAYGDVNADCAADLVIGIPGNGRGKVRVVSPHGLGTHSRVFGLGCVGSNGITPQISTFGGTPTSVGTPAFGIALTCALGASPAVLQLGFSDQVWNGVPLPLDLSPLGVSGCALFVAADLSFQHITTGALPGTGAIHVALPIPNDAAFAGLQIFGQWMIIDTGAPNGLLAMSRALRVTIQQIP